MNLFLKILIGGFIGGLFASILVHIIITNISDKPSVDLPEEYQLITPNDKLQGKYDKTTNTIHIWFNNPQNNNNEKSSIK
jgi:hypothetical protein